LWLRFSRRGARPLPAGLEAPPSAWPLTRCCLSSSAAELGAGEPAAEEGELGPEAAEEQAAEQGAESELELDEEEESEGELCCLVWRCSVGAAG